MYLLESTAHPIPSEKEQGKVGITGSAKSRDNRPSVRGCDRQITGTLNILLFEIMLQFITHHTDRYDEIAGTRAVLEGGCRWVQLRMKDAPAEEVLRIGREIEKLCREYGLSVVEQPRSKEPARYARMREAIDQACEDASTPEDFHKALYRQGYIFGSDPHRKYATIRARDAGRAVRLYRLGKEYDLPAIDDRLRGNYLLYGPRLYERKHPPRQYTPKRYRPTENRSILQIFFEVFFGESQMHRLYLYYCYQLGILPKKQQPRINRPELERIWKDTEKILAEHAFVHDHKFPSLQAIVDYRKGLSQRMETLTAQRAEIVKQMRRKDASPELADRRAMLTCRIAELRKEDKIAEGAIKRIQRTRESNRIDRENQERHTNHNRRRDRSRQR